MIFSQSVAIRYSALKAEYDLFFLLMILEVLSLFFSYISHYTRISLKDLEISNSEISFYLRCCSRTFLSCKSLLVFSFQLAVTYHAFYIHERTSLSHFATDIHYIRPSAADPPCFAEYPRKIISDNDSILHTVA